MAAISGSKAPSDWPSVKRELMVHSIQIPAATADLYSVYVVHVDTAMIF